MGKQMTMNDKGEWVEACYAVQMRGKDWEVANILEFYGKRWRTLRYCDTREMAEREMSSYAVGRENVRKFRIVELVDGEASFEDADEHDADEHDLPNRPLNFRDAMRSIKYTMKS